MTSSSSFVYQELHASDVPLLKKLLRVFGEAFEDIPTYQQAIPTDEYLQRFLAKPHVMVVISRQDDEVVGGLVAYELEKFEQDRREIYIYDLAVAAPYRRQGIATRLIHELKQIAKQRHAYVIYVQADKTDPPAIALYKSLGQKEDVFHFDIPVED